jgi:hypothetical protein
MLCPNEESALIHIRRDQKLTAVFQAVAQTLAHEFDTGNVQVIAPTGTNQTLFFVLAYYVRGKMELILQRNGNRWD